MCFPLTLSKNTRTKREGRSLETWGSLQPLGTKHSDHVAQLSISSILFSKHAHALILGLANIGQHRNKSF